MQAMARRKLGYGEWWDLPDWERTDYLAYEVWRVNALDAMTHALIDGQKYTPETHAMIATAKLA